MGIIRQLTTEVINQIAAGEVVERPSSVVKELVENALDAGATDVVIELQEGGTHLIRVTDNGSGMSKDDAQACVLPHTTSKLSKIDDLHSLATMGFRGEALASISSVSKFEIITKRLEDPIGTRVEVTEEGVVTEEIAAPEGTQVSVVELFFNVPARKKFLKKNDTEYLHILDLIVGFALLHHRVSWKLIHNGHLVHDLPASVLWIDRVKALLGLNVSKDLLPLRVEGTTTIDGFVGTPLLARSNRKQQFLYVNGRLVSDFAISKAVAQAFGHLLTDKSYPLYILHLNIPKEKIDINVHPRKTEVRFSEPQEVYRLVVSAVRNLLVQHGVQQSADIPQETNQYAPVDNLGILFKPASQASRLQKTYSNQTPLQPILKADHSFQSVNAALRFAQAIAKEHSKTLQHEREDDWKLIGQMHNSYLLVETHEGFLVIDQHAAAERLNYEKLKDQVASHANISQPLLLPLTIELGISQWEVVRAAAQALENLGFQIEFFGGQTIALQAVPQLLSKADVLQVFKNIISDLEQESDHLHSLEEAQEISLKYTACRGAIMFADRLSVDEQIQLLADIKKLPMEKQVCAHGRPFMKEFKKVDLEKIFHRR